MLDKFCVAGRADVTIGLQFGSEGKGAAVAWLAARLNDAGGVYNIVTTNASSQAGHTAIHNERVFVTRHLPTAPLIASGSTVYLNAGCAIDPVVLEEELVRYQYLELCDGFFIHPNAAVITEDCIAAESPDDSDQAKIGSTRKGVGQAIARKVLRSGMVASDHPFLRQFVQRLDLNARLTQGQSVLVEVPQGYGLSLNGQFYPHCTSRDCTVMQGLSDAHIHPRFMGAVMGVCRVYPIRVGGPSGGCYPDQEETTWDKLELQPEFTTVTKRQRRVFTWSRQQVEEAMAATRPDLVFLSHIDQLTPDHLPHGLLSARWPPVSDISDSARRLKLQVTIVGAAGPTTDHPFLVKGRYPLAPERPPVLGGGR